MSLTKQDLSAISQIIDTKLKPVSKDIRTLGNKVSDLDGKVSVLGNKVSDLDGKVSRMEKDIKKLTKDSKIIVNYFDKNDIRIKKRVERIEKHFGLPPYYPTI